MASIESHLKSHNAVEVEGVKKSYGSPKRRVPVLKNLSMTVPTGTIYGLLGPSGCGKTTLLRCVIGRLAVDSGTVCTLGKCPGSVGHDIPGRLVGYMPQEIALYAEFSISEILMYFGRLHKMPLDLIRVRTLFLIQLLDLPEGNRLIGQLSTGQQRRASFAAALLQDPALLVLDEPTVGVDPMLRQAIWKHLVSLSETKKVTIIITTHYIEEAKQAQVVGLMRHGRLLAEESPQQLQTRYNMSTLEDVFLHLCEVETDQKSEDCQNLKSSSSDAAAVEDVMPMTDVTVHQPDLTESGLPSNGSIRKQSQLSIAGPPGLWFILCWYLPSGWNILAIFMKELNILRRRIFALFFELLLPSFQIVMFCLCIGGNPFDLPMAVVNNETAGQYSTRFLDRLDRSVIVQENYDYNFVGAMSAAKNADVWGIIEIGENFTRDLDSRFSKFDVDNATLDGCTVHLHLDMTNSQISMTIRAEIMKAFGGFLTEFLPAGMARFPIKMETPVYGGLEEKLNNYVSPGIIISIPFFMATGLTAMMFVIERKEGLLDRSFVAGVGAIEVMIGHVTIQFLVMIVQAVLVLITALAIFEVRCEGSFVLAMILTLLQGLTGMALGLLISTVAPDETSAMAAGLAAVFPNLMICGIIWPLEAMPYWLRYFAYCLPLTAPAEAMRCIMSRGWGFTYDRVWQGFLVSFGYCSLLMVVAAIFFTRRSK